jgi:hypothetical protein
MHEAPAFLFGKDPTTKDDRRLKLIQRMLKDLDWLYTTARDSGEREAISFVESVMDSWVDAELEFKAEEKADD